MAVSQSNIQSLLQDLSGVHTGGQAWVPNSGVSGNPNTAYNNPMPKAGAQAVQAPPMGDAGGFPPQQQQGVPWSVPPNNFQGAVDWQTLAAKDPSNTVPAGFKGFPNILQGAGVGWKPDAVGIGTPPPGTGTPPPGGTPPMGTGGNDPAQQIGNIGTKFNGPNDPLFTQGISNGRGLNLMDLPPGFTNNLFSGTKTAGSVSSKDFTSAFGSMGNMNMNLGAAGKALGSTSLGRALGVTPDGTVDVMQIVDLFVPGNVWMGQTHQTNWMNLIPALAGKLNPLLGMAVSKVMDYFGAKYANEDDSKLGTGLLGSIRRAVRNRYMKNQANRAAAHQPPGANLGGGDGGMGGGSTGGFGLGGGWLGGGMMGNIGFSNGNYVYMDGPNKGQIVPPSEVAKATDWHDGTGFIQDGVQGQGMNTSQPAPTFMYNGNYKLSGGPNYN